MSVRPARERQRRFAVTVRPPHDDDCEHVDTYGDKRSARYAVRLDSRFRVDESLDAMHAVGHDTRSGDLVYIREADP